MLRQLRKHNKPFIMATAFFFAFTILLSLLASLASLFL